MRESISSPGASGRAERWFDDGEGTEELTGFGSSFRPSPSSRSKGMSQVCSMPSRNPVSGRPTFPASCVRMFGRRSSSCWKMFPRPTGQTRSVRRPDRIRRRTAATDPRPTKLCIRPPCGSSCAWSSACLPSRGNCCPVNDPIYAQAYGVRALVRAAGRSRPHEGGTHGLFKRRRLGLVLWPFPAYPRRLSHGAFPFGPYGGAFPARIPMSRSGRPCLAYSGT